MKNFLQWLFPFPQLAPDAAVDDPCVSTLREDLHRAQSRYEIAEQTIAEQQNEIWELIERRQMDTSVKILGDGHILIGDLDLVVDCDRVKVSKSAGKVTLEAKTKRVR